MEDEADKLMREVIEGELVGVGQFLTDKTHMSRKVSAEIEKIFNEKLLPYKLYVKNSVKNLSWNLSKYLIFAGLIFSAAKSITNINTAGIIAILLLISVESLLRDLLDLPDHGFYIGPLLKLHRAKKLFKQVCKELHTDAMEGKVDVADLMTAFDAKEKEILGRAKAIQEQEKERLLKKEEELRQSKLREKDLIEKAKNSKI